MEHVGEPKVVMRVLLKERRWESRRRREEGAEEGEVRGWHASGFEDGKEPQAKELAALDAGDSRRAHPPWSLQDPHTSSSAVGPEADFSRAAWSVISVVASILW